MEIAPTIIFIGLLVFLAHFFTALFERTRIPDVLWLIIIGLIIGPVFRVLTPEDFGKVGPIFTTVALVVILFEGGLEIGVDSLRSSIRSTAVITLLSYFIAFTCLTTGLILVTPLSLAAILFASAVLSGPAPSVILPLVRQLKLTDASRTTLLMEAPLGEALSIVVALAVLESLSLHEVKVGKVIGALLASFVFALLIGVGSGYFWSILLERMRQLRNAILTTPSFVFIVYGFTEFLHFSGPVSALAFGITLGNADLIRIPWLASRVKLQPMQHNETERLFFGEIAFLLKTFFFVYLGLSIRLTDTWAMGVGLITTILLLVARFVAVRLTFVKSWLPANDAATMAVLIPKGTAAAVLASLPLQLGISGGEFIQNIIYSVVVWSIVLTSLLVFLLEHTALGDRYARLFTSPGNSKGPD